MKDTRGTLIELNASIHFVICFVIKFLHFTKTIKSDNILLFTVLVTNLEYLNHLLLTIIMLMTYLIPILALNYMYNSHTNEC